MRRAARPVAEQEQMAKALAQRGMTMGVFVASMPKWAQVAAAPRRQ